MTENKKIKNQLGLFKAMTNALGFSRTGTAITDRLNRALWSLKDTLDITGDVISLKVNKD